MSINKTFKKFAFINHHKKTVKLNGARGPEVMVSPLMYNKQFGKHRYSIFLFYISLHCFNSESPEIARAIAKRSLLKNFEMLQECIENIWRNIYIIKVE